MVSRDIVCILLLLGIVVETIVVDHSARMPVNDSSVGYW